MNYKLCRTCFQCPLVRYLSVFLRIQKIIKKSCMFLAGGGKRNLELGKQLSFLPGRIWAFALPLKSGSKKLKPRHWLGG